MKNLLKVLISIGLLAALLVPISGLAQAELPNSCTLRRDTGIIECTKGMTIKYDETYGTVKGALCCLISTVYYITDLMFFALITVSVIFVIMGGFLFIQSQGSPEKLATAKSYIVYAIIGVLVGLLAKAIPALAKMVVGI